MQQKFYEANRNLIVNINGRLVHRDRDPFPRRNE